MLRAAYEGVALSLATVKEFLEESPGGDDNFDGMELIGGGALNRTFTDILAATLDLPLRISARPRSSTSLGAALVAGVAAGIWPDLDTAASLVPRGETVTPDPRVSAVYREALPLFRSLYPALRDTFADLADWRDRLNGGQEGDQSTEK